MNLGQLANYYIEGSGTKFPKNTKKAVLKTFELYLKKNNLDIYYEQLGPSKFEETHIKDNLISYIVSFKGAGKKAKNLALMHDFWGYLTTKGYIPLNPILKLPKNIHASEDERRLALIKYLQEKPREIKWLVENLLVSEKTIRTDIKAIKSGQEGLWKFPIIELRTRKGEVQYSCSIHPLIFSFNLTALAELMVGMESLLKTDFHYKEPFKVLIGQLWPQLTDYAKARIEKLGVLEPADAKELHFINEQSYLENHIIGNLIHSIKTGYPVTLRVIRNNSLCDEKVQVLSEGSDWSGNKDVYFRVRHIDTKEESTLFVKDIIRACTT